MWAAGAADRPQRPVHQQQQQQQQRVVEQHGSVPAGPEEPSCVNLHCVAPGPCPRLIHPPLPAPCPAFAFCLMYNFAACVATLVWAQLDAGEGNNKAHGRSKRGGGGKGKRAALVSQVPRGRLRACAAWLPLCRRRTRRHRAPARRLGCCSSGCASRCCCSSSAEGPGGQGAAGSAGGQGEPRVARSLPRCGQPTAHSPRAAPHTQQVSRIASGARAQEHNN